MSVTPAVLPVDQHLVVSPGRVRVPASAAPDHALSSGIVLVQGPASAARIVEGFLATSCKSPHSRRAMVRALGAIAHELSDGREDMHTFQWPRLERSDVTRLYEGLTAGVEGQPERAASANQMLSALRGVLLESWRQGFSTREELDRMLDGIETFPPNNEPRGHALDMGEVFQLFRSCATDKVATRAARDSALLGVLYGRGLRRAEAAGATLGAYGQHPKLPDTMALRVLGKGNKPRDVPIGGNVLAALEAWIEVRARAVMNIPGALDPTAPLFTAINKGGKISADPLTAHAIYRLLQRLALRAGVRAFSPHDLRRTCISELIDAGADIAATAALAGHVSVTTTQRYDRRGARAVVSAATRLHVPYVQETSP